MVDAPAPALVPTFTRSNTTRYRRYTFPIQLRSILRDLMKKGLLHPLD